MASIGILGGSFNPPHTGHLAIARAAISQLGLDRVLLVPVNEAPHKTIESDPGSDVRAALCRIACEGVAGVEVSTIELDRPGPSWTSETLSLLRKQHPGDELFLLLGEDMARSLGGWHRPGDVVRDARICWVARGDAAGSESAAAEVGRIVGALGGRPPVTITMPPIAVSSTEVRERIQRGLPVTGLVPAGVEWEIAERGLYRAG